MKRIYVYADGRSTRCESIYPMNQQNLSIAFKNWFEELKRGRKVSITIK